MKLPVFRAVGATFGFIVDNWVTILVIAWAPLLLTAGLTIAFGAWVSASDADLMARRYVDYAEMQGYASLVGWLNNALSVVSGLISLILVAGLLRFVIRDEKPTMPFYLRWGSDEWNLLGTTVVLFVGAILVTFVTSMVFGLFAAQLIYVPYAMLGVGVLVLCLFAWLVVKVCLAFPAAVGFDQMGVVPAWEASSGRFWSLLGYMLIWIVLGALYQIAVVLIVVPDILSIFSDAMSRGATSAEISMLIQQALTPDSAEGIARMVLLWVLSFVPTVVGAVSLGMAWRFIDNQSHVKQADVFGSASDTSASDIMGF